MVKKHPQPRSMIFDQIAEQYDTYRPAYPEPLIEAIIDRTGIDGGSSLLEIGSGTGKATRMLAERGFQVHCIEPGANLIRVAERHLERYPRVTFENTTLEKWEISENTFDVVFSASAFHWVSKETGYSRVDRALKEGGYLALFWNNSDNSHTDLCIEINRVYDRCVPEMQRDHNSAQYHIQQREDELKGCGLFDYLMTARYPWQRRYTTEQYIGMLNTHSSHLSLPEEKRKCLYQGIEEVIDRHAGVMVKSYLAVLYLAQKRPGSSAS